MMALASDPAAATQPESATRLEERVLALTTTDGPITWKAASSGTVTRRAGASERQWAGLPEIRWDPQGAVLRVQVGSGERAEEATLISQVMAGGQP
jgi:hypothetical protein